MKKLFVLIFLSFSVNIIICVPITDNEYHLLYSSYQNNVQKKYEEANQFLSNGTVTRFNIIFRFKLYLLKLGIYRMERNIEKLKNKRTNDKKYLEDYYENEKSFLNGFRHLLKIIKQTNNLYSNVIKILKTVFFVIIGIILLGGIIGFLIMLYISKYKGYKPLVDKDKKNKNDKYQIVEIFNNFFKFNKKLDWIFYLKHENYFLFN